MSRTASTLRWAIQPRAAIAHELGLSLQEARTLIRPLLSRRRWALNLGVPAAFIVGAGGWLGLLAAVTTVYEQVTTFHPDGSIARTEATGPFGISVYPLLAAAILGYGLAWLLGTVSAFAFQYGVLGREARRCVRLPACFACGYDLSGAVGETCPECGTRRGPRLAARSVQP